MGWAFYHVQLETLTHIPFFHIKHGFDDTTTYQGPNPTNSPILELVDQSLPTPKQSIPTVVQDTIFTE